MWLTILLVMLWAGFWQLGRAEEKRIINERLSVGEVQEPETEQQWMAQLAFERVKFSGHYSNTHFLLDNQIMDGQVGFFVYTTFKTTAGLWLLVNRGWHDQEQTDFDVIDEFDSLEGLVADWPRPGVKLGEQLILNQDIQHVTYLDQTATLKTLKQRLCEQNTGVGCIILPLVLKLDPGMPHGYKREWQLPRMTVAKHQAYAAQWFTMSLVLCLVYGIFMKKHFAKEKDASKN